MVCEKLILLLLNVLVMFVFLLKIRVVLGCGENLTVPEVFIFKNFQCIMDLDS